MVTTATRSARRIVRRGMIGRCLLERRSPRHVRVDAADVRVRPGRQRRNLVDARLDAVEDLALERHRARRVLQLDVVGRARVLVDERDGERLAGWCRERRLDVRRCPGRGSVTSAVTGPPGAPDAGGPDATGPPDPGGPEAGGGAPGEPDADGPPAPAAEFVVNTPDCRTAAPTIRTTRTVNIRRGVPGGGPLSRWPVVSASTTRRYSMTASVSQPISVAIRAMTPTARSQPPKTRPRNRANTPNAPRNGRHDGPGMWTPGGGPSWIDGRELRGRRADVVVVDPQALGQPVEQRQDERDDARGRGSGRRRRARGDAGRAPTAAKNGAKDGPGMWMPAGVLRRTRPLPRRAGGASASIRKSRSSTTTTSDEDADRDERDEHAPVGRDELRGQLEDAGPEPFEHRSGQLRCASARPAAVRITRPTSPATRT